MNAQNILDRVAEHLMRQGHRAVNGSHGCVYRAPNGDRCAVGCLIPDDAYNSIMENKLAESSLITARMPPWYTQNLSLLRDLQRIHDTALDNCFRKDVSTMLESLSIERRLKSPFRDNTT